MDYAIIIAGSINKASLFKRSIESQIPHTSVIQTPTSIKSGGCSYCVRFHRDYAEQVRALAHAEGLKKVYIYAEKTLISGEKEYTRI